MESGIINSSGKYHFHTDNPISTNLNDFDFDVVNRNGKLFVDLNLVGLLPIENIRNDCVITKLNSK